MARAGRGKALGMRSGARHGAWPRRAILPPDLSRRARTDLPALTTLSILLATVLAYAATLPLPPLAFPIDQPPSQVTLQGVFVLERNAAGPFRWTKAATLPSPRPP